MNQEELGAIREALGTVFAEAGCWTEADTANITIDADGRFANVATYGGSDHGVARLIPDGVLVVFDEDPMEPDFVQSILVSVSADGEPMLEWDYLDAEALAEYRVFTGMMPAPADTPGSAAGIRAEADTCERGTPGCSVVHTRDSECATW